MPNALIGSTLPILLFLLALQFRCSSAMVLRLHASALRDLAEMTKHWMNDTVKSHFPLRSHSKHLAHRLGQGRLQLHNLSIIHFSPPEINYQASKSSLLYLTTDGGNSEISAQWSLQSDFLLSIIRSPAFAGIVRARITGFSADVSIKVAQKSQLALHQCISRFDDFQLHLGGSLAADLIHWFHRPLAQAMQSHVEETYCQLIGEKLLPWLRDQLARLTLKLHIDFGAELQLTQWLHWMKTGEGHLDLGMTQRLVQRGEGRRNRVLAEIMPWELPAKDKLEDHGSHSVEFFLPESTLQQVFSGAHLSKQFQANFSAPFLRTSCPIFCLGKFVPQMRSILGPIQLRAVLRTNNSPIVRLYQNRIRLNLNVSFELFEHWKTEDRGKSSEELQLMTNYDGGIEEEQKKGEDEAIQQEMDEENEGEEEEEELGDEQWEEGADESEDGTLIRPKFVGVNGPRRETAVPSTQSTIVFSSSPTSSTTAKEEMHLMSTSSQRPRLPSLRHEPVLKIVLDSELEILLILDKKRRKLKTELTLSKVRAVLAQSQIRDFSQKTIDLLVEASIPFLENSVRILYREVLQLDDLLPLPTRNESVHVEEGFIRYSADISLAQLLKEN